MNPTCFVIRRPDGFAGVEVSVDDQLTPDETRDFARRMLSCADEVDPPAPMWRVLPGARVTVVDLESRDGRCWARLVDGVGPETVEVSFRPVHLDGESLAAAWTCDLAKAAHERRYACRDVEVTLLEAQARVVLEGPAALLVARGFFGLPAEAA